MKQTRAIVLTDQALYNLDKSNLSTVKRRIPVQDIFGMTVDANSDEFLLHVVAENDYRFVSVRMQ